jgi:hypothetical protein
MTDNVEGTMNEYLIRWLLVGPHAPFPPGCRGVRDLPADALAELTVLTSTPGAIAQAWEDDKEELRAEAARLGIEPRWPGERFFAEACAACIGKDATR